MDQILVVSGYATAGKDSVADILVKELGWYKTYMSRPLEKALLVLDPIVDRDLNLRFSEVHEAVGYDESKKNPEVRRLLQILGTEIGREMFGENVWLDLVREEVFQKSFREARDVVITGVRYRNELDIFRRMGAVSVWVNRPGVLPVNGHSSDNTLDPESFDFIIDNDGSLDDLKIKVLSGLVPKLKNLHPKDQ